jgi:catechol 2,3-dioxygenase-like lactoylglutathione lyase family enzyme
VSGERTAPVRVIGFDHVVLNVADVERSLAFYCDQLGLEPERVEEWRRGESPFPSARISATGVIDLVAAPRDGQNMAHLCVVIEPVDFGALNAAGHFTVVEGPATRWGAQGWATSLYVLDPDGNVVELRYY